MEKVIIVEDEFSIALDIENCLQNQGFEVIGIAASHGECKALLEESTPEVIVMDVNLKNDENGIQLAKWIHIHYDIAVVFLTALSDKDTLNRILETESFGFLTKPFKEKDLCHTLKLAIKNHQLLKKTKQEILDLQNLSDKFSFDDKFFVKEKGKLLPILVSEILFIEALENYSQIVLKEKKYLINAFLKDFEPKLPSQFMRIHRSFIASLPQITKIEDSYVHFQNLAVPIGKSYKAGLMKNLKIL